MGLGDIDVDDYEIKVDCQTVERPVISILEEQKKTRQARPDTKFDLENEAAFDLRKLGKGNKRSGNSKSKSGRNPKRLE